MKTLNDLNMKYVDVNELGNEEIKGGAVLKCSHVWSIGNLRAWLPSYDLDMIEASQGQLANEDMIAQGQYLEVWVNQENKMTEQELANIDKFVAQLRETQQAVYMSCDAELAAVVCLRTSKAIKLIHSLVGDNLHLENKIVDNKENK